MTKTARTLRYLGIGAVTFALVAGCESQDDSAAMEESETLDPQAVQDDVLWDLTPELRGVYDRDDDYAVRISRRVNADFRMFWDDLINSMYWDRPSRLNRRPMP